MFWGSFYNIQTFGKKPLKCEKTVKNILAKFMSILSSDLQLKKGLENHSFAFDILIFLHLVKGLLQLHVGCKKFISTQPSMKDC